MSGPYGGRSAALGRGAVDGAAADSVRVSTAIHEPEWDAFLARHAGHHTQTAAWARVKALDGWRPLRVLLEDGSGLAAGAQLLHRSARGLGRLGYLPRGPVVAPRARGSGLRALEAVLDATRSARIHALLVEPAPDDAVTPHLVPGRLLVTAHQRLSLGATVRVDTERSPEGMLAAMRSKTRYNVRRGLARGVVVRRAGPDELPVFHRLLEQTGQRQGFEVAGLSHYRRWFDVLGAEGYLHMFLAEYRGEPVSGMLAVAFGDTVVYKRGAWSGRHGDRRPNEALHWSVMQWAHAAGFSWYDLDGIDRLVAEQVVRGQPVPDQHLNSVTRFKLGFGGEVMLLPDGLLHLRSAAARKLYTLLGPRLAASRRVRRTLLTKR